MLGGAPGGVVASMAAICGFFLPGIVKRWANSRREGRREGGRGRERQKEREREKERQTNKLTDKQK